MLYGSVSGRDIADAVKEAGLSIERRQVSLDTPIKVLGTYPVRVSLHPEVALTVNVTVARSQEEAERNAAKAAKAEEVEVEVEEIVVSVDVEAETDGVADEA